MRVRIKGRTKRKDRKKSRFKRESNARIGLIKFFAHQ